MTRLRVGLIGAGTMGALHARTIASHATTDLVWIADPNRAVAEPTARKFSTEWRAEPQLETVDAVVVAAPTPLHHSIALEVIRQQLPLLMEKPLAESLVEVSEIVDASRHADTPLMCGLLERFNPAVRTAFDLCSSPEHFRSIRHSPSAPRITTSVIGDLLIHDVDLAIRLFGRTPQSVQSLCDSSDAGQAEIIETVLDFGGKTVAALSASRRSQRKKRELLITEPGRLIEVDILRQDITIYRHVLEAASEDEIGYQQQTVIDIPAMKYHGEPLALQLQHFTDLIAGTADLEDERSSILPPHAVIDEAAASSLEKT